MKLLTFSNASDCTRRVKMEFLLGKTLCFTFISLLTDDCLKPSPCLRTGGAGRVTDFTARFCCDVLPGHPTRCTVELASPGNLQVPLILWALSFASLMFCSPAVTSPPPSFPLISWQFGHTEYPAASPGQTRTWRATAKVMRRKKSHKWHLPFWLVSLAPSTVCTVPLQDRVWQRVVRFALLINL